MDPNKSAKAQVRARALAPERWPGSWALWGAARAALRARPPPPSARARRRRAPPPLSHPTLFSHSRTPSPSPSSPTPTQAKDRKKALAKRLGKPIHLDGAYEDVIAQEVVNPASIDVSLADVGGLDAIVEDLRRHVITPVRHPEHFRQGLLRAKRGVLLYGPPGTGKTLLAKALAKECGACFINLKASTLLSKWYGDTNKLIHAVWTLAYKIQPTILFIDEVDALLGHRRALEHEATTAMKTEFMQLWEGFESRPHCNVVVLGATNKRDALDEAVLRRFSLQYEVRLPGAAQREAILRAVLRRHVADVGAEYVEAGLLRDVRAGPARAPAGLGGAAGAGAPPPRASPVRDVARRTEGFSGSDLAELCSQAAAIPVHQYLADTEAAAAAAARCDDAAAAALAPRGVVPLSKVHFEATLEVMVPPSRAAQAAQRRAASGGGSGGGRRVGGVGGRGEESRAAAANFAAEVAEGLRRTGAFGPTSGSEEGADRSDDDA
jgi:SpoVK/Ycf46/Vps4 family AAA+-type ATPase